MQAIDINSASLAQLKERAIALGLEIVGDRRLRSTWVKALELAQSAMLSVSEAVGADLVQHGQVFGEAVVEAYGIAHDQFVIPVEGAIVWAWNTTTSERAMRFYVGCAISIMRFAFACYRAGMETRSWCDAIVEEAQEEDLQIVAVLEVKAIEQVKKTAIVLDRQIWEWDAVYQVQIDRVKQEVRSIFSIAEWIALLVA